MITLNDLRSGLTEHQLAIINAIWQYELKRGRPMPAIALGDALSLTESEVFSALEGVGGDIAYSTGPDYVRRRYHLTFLGYLLAEQGEELQDLLGRYLNFARDKLKQDPESERINIPEAMEAAGFSESQKRFFTEMFFRTPFHGGGSPSETNFPSKIDEWYVASDLQQYVGDRAMENYDPATPIEGGRQLFVRVAAWNPLEQTLPLTRASLSDNSAQPVESAEENISKGLVLYEQIAAVMENEKLDRSKARLVIQKIPDSRELLGPTNHEKKTQLAIWEQEASRALPPENLIELINRAWNWFLVFVWPEKRWAQVVFLSLILILVVVSGLFGYFQLFTRR
jgi:hypothetical protein